jgi:hypothetical protein
LPRLLTLKELLAWRHKNRNDPRDHVKWIGGLGPTLEITYGQTARIP